MKLISTLILGLLLSFSSNAQLENFSASLSGNYTMYKWDLKKNTPGVKFELSYSTNERVRLGLSYTYHLAIKEPSVITASDGTTTTEVPSDMRLKFTTIMLGGSYTFIHTEEDRFSLYGILGTALVLAKVDEKPKGSMPSPTVYSDQAATEKVNGVTINLGLGTQYNLGMARLFLDGGIGFPRNTGNDYTYSNPIPFHIWMNAGVRIPFGARSFED